ncbi:MAG: hypothetical protein KFF73_13710 [Cyclobacteriaceae bacterium]|nr:hypothetical protein [Cyclobacteriaceae bacterium]
MKKLFLAITAALLISFSFALAGTPAYSDGDSKSGAEEKVKKSTLNAAIWHRKDGTVSVNFEKKPNEVVIIKLFNGNELLILQDAFSKDNLVACRYDLSKLPKGDYFFEVTNKHDVLRKEISVE